MREDRVYHVTGVDLDRNGRLTLSRVRDTIVYDASGLIISYVREPVWEYRHVG